MAISTARQTAHRLPASPAEPAAPLLIESDANTPARLAPESLLPAQAAAPRPLMCCRPPHSAAPRGNLHPTLAALAAAVQPRGQQTDAAPALPELRAAFESEAPYTFVAEESPSAFGEPATSPPAVIEHPAASGPAHPKLISNPWAQPLSEKPPERPQWRTSQSRPVRQAKFNPPPPQGLSAPKLAHPQSLPSHAPLSLPSQAPSDLPSLDFQDREAIAESGQLAPSSPGIEDHELIDSAGDERTAGENPLRELDAGPAQRPARWSGPNPLR